MGMNFIPTCQINFKTVPGLMLMVQEKFHGLGHKKVLNIFITKTNASSRHVKFGCMSSWSKSIPNCVIPSETAISVKVSWSLITTPQTKFERRFQYW